MPADATVPGYDERSTEIARAHADAPGIRYVLGDFLTSSFRPGSVDLVTAVASVHHMDRAPSRAVGARPAASGPAARDRSWLGGRSLAAAQYQARPIAGPLLVQ